MAIRQMKKLWITGSGLLVLLWMAVIFAFSAQPDTESSQISGGVSYRIIQGWDRVFHREMTQQQMEEAAELIDHPVRKAAHMTEYGILAVLILQVCLAYSGWDKGIGKIRKLCLGALLMTAAYAATDEFHQLFVPGRAGRITDVLIDSAGAAIALLFAGLILKHIKNKKEKRKSGKR